MVLSKIEQCTESVSEDNGKALAILLDGYDEFPESLRETSLIADIINRQVLPECGLIVSSRPHVSQHLHNKATLRVDILGFTETEREHFIKQSLNKQPHKISQLVSYLQDHMTISSLCFTPFNMLVLLFLHKQGFLPQNSTELYKLFICLTIRRHIAKCGNIIPIRDLDQLPEPYDKVIKQLSQLSLEAINNNQLTFTLDQIKSYCPELEAIQGAINGFGLLQVIEHINLFDKTKTFNFIHFSVQEYLAAYYIANLPPDEEHSIIKEYFWSNIHYNMFNFYVTLTEGQHPAFKQFLCSGKEMIAIEDKLFEDERRCLRLYRVFKDTGDLDICHTIEGRFTNKEINLQGTTLSPYNIEDLASLLTCSSCGNWKKINLYNCYIQDYGLRLLHCSLHHSAVTIQELWLLSNNLSSSSDIFLSDIIITCKVRVLSISENKGVGETRHFLTMILTDPSSVIEGLGMYSNNFSSTKWAIHLFSLLRENKTVNKLSIWDNNMSDDACDAVCEALSSNNTLKILDISVNPITGQASQLILDALKLNSTLEKLFLPKYSEDITEEITLRKQIVNEKRNSQGCNIKLQIEFW